MKQVTLILIFCSLGAIANAQLPPGIALLPVDSPLFKTSGELLQMADVPGQPFKKAYHISTMNETGNGSYTFHYAVDAAVYRGDVLLLSFYTRSIQSKKETGESFIEISLDRVIHGKYEWPPVFERGMSFGSQWTLTQIPFIAARDVAKGDLSFVVKCGKFQQVFELGGISLINYRQSLQLTNLPRSTVHYDGDAPDAPWRKAAAERIEKYRKNDLRIKVVDKYNKPVKDARVRVSLKKIAFGWGTAISSNFILDTQGADAKTYRDTLQRYFNKVVFDNEVKSKNWARSDHHKTLEALVWLRQHDITARGHVMVWPSWENSPQLVKYKNYTASLRAAILREIDEETSLLKNQFAEWDVVNEPYKNNNIIDSLGGKKVMVDWFKAARRNTPGVKLFLNDYTMFHAQAGATDSFYNNVKFLQSNGAPVDAIGEQAHIGGTAPAIEYVIEQLNHFASFGLPIQITEFDITSDDDDFKARYMRDFMTAVFSHPSAIGFVQWGFWANAHWIPAAALWDKDWNIRPEGKVYTELVSKTWNTQASGITSSTGEYQIRGFNGNYEISVTRNGKAKQQKYTLDNKSGTVIIKLN